MNNTVIFDMDGLLVNSEPFWREAMSGVFAEMNIELETEDYAKTVGLPTSEIVEYWSHLVDYKGRSNEEVENAIVDLAKGKILKKATLMEGVHYILDFFKERNFKMGLASSSPMRMITGVLNRFELASYFETLHSGEHHELGKPHPAVYLARAQELSTKPTDCLVFEDSVNGMVAGKAARMKVVAVPELHNQQDPRYSLADLKLNSLAEFDEEKLKFLQALK